MDSLEEGSPSKDVDTVTMDNPESVENKNLSEKEESNLPEVQKAKDSTEVEMSKTEMVDVPPKETEEKPNSIIESDNNSKEKEHLDVKEVDGENFADSSSATCDDGDKEVLTPKADSTASNDLEKVEVTPSFMPQTESDADDLKQASGVAVSEEAMISESDNQATEVAVSEGVLVPESENQASEATVSEGVLDPESENLASDVIVSEGILVPESENQESDVTVSEGILVPESENQASEVTVSEGILVPESENQASEVTVSEGILVPESENQASEVTVSEGVLVPESENQESEVVSEGILVPEPESQVSEVVVSEGVLVPDNELSEECANTMAMVVEESQMINEEPRSDVGNSAALHVLECNADEEADGIGGLVINSVVGAFGELDDNNDEEKDITDISSPAFIPEKSCDSQPPSKRMRVAENNSDVPHAVGMKVKPVKIDSELWDSNKLRSLLLEKGSVLLRLCVAEPIAEEEFDVPSDFTGVLLDSSEDLVYSMYGQPHRPPNMQMYTVGVDGSCQPHIEGTEDFIETEEVEESLSYHNSIGEWQGTHSYYTPYHNSSMPPPPPPGGYYSSPLSPTFLKGKHKHGMRGRPLLHPQRALVSPPPTHNFLHSNKKHKNKFDDSMGVTFRPPTPPPTDGSGADIGFRKCSSLLSIKRPAPGSLLSKQLKVLGIAPETTTKQVDLDPDHMLLPMNQKIHCEYCTASFRKKSSMFAHLKHKHRLMKKCPICNVGVRVKGKHNMKFHILKAHKEVNTFTCGKCGDVFKLQHHLRNHFRIGCEPKEEVEEPPVVEEEKQDVDMSLTPSDIIKPSDEDIVPDEVDNGELETSEIDISALDNRPHPGKRKRQSVESEDDIVGEKLLPSSKIAKLDGETSLDAVIRAVSSLNYSKHGTLLDSSILETDYSFLSEEDPEMEGKGKLSNMEESSSNETGKVSADESETKSSCGNEGTNDDLKDSNIVEKVDETSKTEDINDAISTDNNESAKSNVESNVKSSSKVSDQDSEIVNENHNDKKEEESRSSPTPKQCRALRRLKTDLNDAVTTEPEVPINKKSAVNSQSSNCVNAKVMRHKTNSKDLPNSDEEPEESIDGSEKSSRVRKTRKQMNSRQASDSEDESDRSMQSISTRGNRRIVKRNGSKRTSPAKQENTSGDDSSSESDDSESEIEEQKKFFCRVCNEGFSHKFKLNHHLKEAHKNSSNKRSEAHKDNVEVDTSELKCGECSKICRNKTLLDAHMLTHQNKKKLVRQSKATNEVNNKRNIEDEDHSEGETSSLLEMDLDDQEDYEEEPSSKEPLPSYIIRKGRFYVCVKCSLSFKREKSVIYHMKKIHETLYPFKACPHCNRVFRSCGPFTKHLKSHKMTHCPVDGCKAKYRTVRKIKQHQKASHSDYPHRCLRCVMIYKEKEEYEEHMRTNHLRKEEEDDEDGEEEGEENEEGEDMDQEDNEEGMTEDEKNKSMVDKMDLDKLPDKRRTRTDLSYREEEEDEIFKGTDLLVRKRRPLIASSLPPKGRGKKINEVEKLKKTDFKIFTLPDQDLKRESRRRISESSTPNASDKKVLKPLSKKYLIDGMVESKVVLNKITPPKSIAKKVSPKKKISNSWTAALKARIKAEGVVKAAEVVTVKKKTKTDKVTSPTNSNRVKSPPPSKSMNGDNLAALVVQRVAETLAANHTDVDLKPEEEDSGVYTPPLLADNSPAPNSFYVPHETNHKSPLLDKFPPPPFLTSQYAINHIYNNQAPAPTPIYHHPLGGSEDSCSSVDTAQDLSIDRPGSPAKVLRFDNF